MKNKNITFKGILMSLMILILFGLVGCKSKNDINNNKTQVSSSEEKMLTVKILMEDILREDIIREDILREDILREDTLEENRFRVNKTNKNNKLDKKSIILISTLTPLGVIILATGITLIIIKKKNK